MFDGLDAVVFKPKDGKDRPGLYLEECSYQAAKYAVEHWHYSGTLPSTVLSLGVWENGSFTGAIVFGRGATISIGKPYGLEQLQIAELVRVALNRHDFQVSKVINIASRMLKKAYPDTRLIVSYADSSKGHHGGIYQGAGWMFTGGSSDTGFIINGRQFHRRSLGAYGYGAQSVAWVRKHLDPNAEHIRMLPKFKYLYPLDAAMRAQIEPLRKPYPKCVGSVAGGTVSFQETGDGPNPIPTLRAP